MYRATPDGKVTGDLTKFADVPDPEQGFFMAIRPVRTISGQVFVQGGRPELTGSPRSGNSARNVKHKGRHIVAGVRIK